MTWIALPWRCGRSFDGYADVNKVWGTERIMGRCAGEPSFNEGTKRGDPLGMGPISRRWQEG
jgi:hypothetical protein